ncbi:MAG: S9 family peptidase [FCB group bacterium]|nr:S9 family peptidase [FCB group bacterium]
MIACRESSFSICVLLLILLISYASYADNSIDLQVGEYLMLGPMPLHNTLFGEGDQVKSWLDHDDFDYRGLLPMEGGIVNWMPSISGTWQKSAGEATEFTPAGSDPAAGFIAAYVTTDRRQTLTVKVETPYPAALFIDGIKEIQINSLAEETIPNLLYTDVDLHTGKHLILIKTIKPIGEYEQKWQIHLKVNTQDGYDSGTVSFTTDPVKIFSQYKDYSTINGISSVVISADGKLCAIECSKRNQYDYQKHKWIEIRKAAGGALHRSIDFNKSINTPRFSSDGKSLYFKSSADGSSLIWKCDLETGQSQKIFSPVDGLVKFIISPDDKFVYYSSDADRLVRGTDDYTLKTTLEERLTDWSDARTLHSGSLSDGTSHRLTARGDFALDEFALSPESDRIVFTRRTAIEGRPFFRTEFWSMNLLTGENRLLQSRLVPFETRPLNLTFIPDTDYLVFTMAGHFTGEDEIDGVLMNLSEVDIWSMDLNTLEMKNLTGDNPAPTGEPGYTVDEKIGSINSLFWNPRDKRLYYGAMVRGYNKVYSLAIENPGDVRAVETSQVYMKRADISANGRKMVFTSEGLDRPVSAHTIDLKNGKSELIFDPNPNLSDNFKMGAYEHWDFTDSLGHVIDGWILYPPDFDADKKYPCIVYYYAGVWMLDESFYYTYQFWNANGYIVYALSPVGAMGHGDEFSAYHVNDWGTHATNDIIEGVRKLTAEKNFIDADRMGCYGGSYGGFTTMDLLTKTDVFACGVSMYGISNIASYWGGGVWGYTYGDIALAKSYPWNRKDLFTDNSPLFNADKINTPLLLLHGEDDVNVPELESQQMFTALKVLGREAAMVTFPGEGHGIVGKFENYIAHREMMLEWFDKYLKDQPEGWERRWK